MLAIGGKEFTTNDCPLPPGSRVIDYFRDSGGDKQERSVAQQRRVADAFCQQQHLVLVRLFADEARPGGTIVGHIYEAMLEWKAEQDLQDISKDVKRGLSDLVETRGPDGKYLGLCLGKPSTGFKGEPYTLGVKRDGTPRIVQHWAPDSKTHAPYGQAWPLRIKGPHPTLWLARTRRM